MVIVKLLGAMDFATMIAILLLQHDLIGWRLGFAFMAWLMFKGYYFLGDISSTIDFACGIYMLLMILGVKTIIAYIIMAYLAQKIAFTLMS